MNNQTGIPCRRCGKCCLTNLFAYVTDEDMERWRREGRDDILHILENEAPVWAGDRILSARTGREISGCPFLETDGSLASCTIYETRPGVCRSYIVGSSELCIRFRGRLT